MNEHVESEEQSPAWGISMGMPGDPPPPGTTLPRKVKFQEAKESEDYHGIYRDLEFVVSVTRQLRAALLQQGDTSGDAPSPTSAADYVLRSLWIAALVTYARCFHEGKRRWLNESVFEGQTEDILTYHRYFRDTRDKHVAHSVNPFEIHATGINVVDRDGDDPRVDGVVTMYLTRGHEAPKVVGYLEWLATYAKNVAWEKHQEASDKVLERAEALSKDQLRRLPPLEVMPQQSFEAAKKRRR